MNQRIQELAVQAGIKITPMVVDGIEYEYEDVEMDGSEDLTKFAELIVRECLERIKVVISEEAMPVTSDYFLYDFKQHFGVEE